MPRDLVSERGVSCESRLIVRSPEEDTGENLASIRPYVHDPSYDAMML
jgi:hypothetical protein